MNVDYVTPASSNHHRTFLVIFIGIVALILIIIFIDMAVRSDDNIPAETCRDVTVTPPSALSAQVESNAIVLSWTGNQNDMVYQVYQSTNPNFNVSDTGPTRTRTTENTFIRIDGSSLTEGEVIYFRVVAINENSCRSVASPALKVVYQNIEMDLSFLLEKDGAVVSAEDDHLVISEAEPDCQDILTLKADSTLRRGQRCVLVNNNDEIVLGACSNEVLWSINANNELCLRQDSSRCADVLPDHSLVVSNRTPAQKWDFIPKAEPELPWCGPFIIKNCQYA